MRVQCTSEKRTLKAAECQLRRQEKRNGFDQAPENSQNNFWM